ncbi:MAG: carbamoyltransferase HypF [Isosphaeraceae bacterium]|nr:carbamoyltransferase HypF [Isosphaeraceae bacterium]
MDRRAIAISGIVQGVGFRPFVYDLATRLGLHGFVRNQTGDVLIEVEGESQSLDRFFAELISRPPPLARIKDVRWVARLPRGDPHFRIEPSAIDSAGLIFISPDVATCDDCLRELFDPQDRRYRYPFLNCTNCGPRLTIIRGAPYDRERTTMASFAMCLACRSEYEDPSDRRFHAQPTACPSCGPRLQALDGHGRVVETDDPLAYAIEALRLGKIVALKGLGGYHLACLASDDRAVAELRRRKHRDEKPLALMVRDLPGAQALCEISAAEQALLTSPRRPIVLLRRRPEAPVAEGVAPRNPYLGVLLPYTPLHHLLLHDLDGAPLVMTSGNRSDEPIAYDDLDARERLAGIADRFLTNDRPIHLRCDDAVTRLVAGAELPLRRSRGDAPHPLDLPVPCHRPILALGGQLKATFALGRDRHAFLSHHIGDLDHYAAYRAYVEAIAHYEQLLALRPELIAHDLHPDYASTRYAGQRDSSIPRLAVQHHHAHMASCMADNGLDEPVIGVAFDGTGFGTDGAIWGGEFLTGDYRGVRRAAHLRYVAMPGGEQAIREPWRMALAYLGDAEQEDTPLRNRVPAAALATARRLIERRFNAPLTSSAGRLFDAVAALAGVRDSVSFEGQAAMELEWLASGVPVDGVYPFEIQEAREDESPLLIDLRPLICEVAAEVRRGLSAPIIGRRFHSTLVEIVAQVCSRLRRQTGLGVVALSGGVFLNALLTVEVTERLERDGFRAYRHHRVPPSDGGLSLGQLVIAAVRVRDGNSTNGQDSTTWTQHDKD